MKPSPAFQFYPHEFLVGTADMSAEEVGGYVRLLCYQWAKGGLPNDDAKLMNLSGCHGSAMAAIRLKFGLGVDGLLRNDRLEEVRQEQNEYRARQAANASKRRVGTATAQPRQSDGTTTASGLDERRDCPSPSNTLSIGEISEAHIPTEAEFISAFATVGIPDDYLRQKYAYFEGNRKWITTGGQLVRFVTLVSSWWSKDRATWKPSKPEHSKRKETPAEYEARILREAQS